MSVMDTYWTRLLDREGRIATWSMETDGLLSRPHKCISIFLS